MLLVKTQNISNFSIGAIADVLLGLAGGLLCTLGFLLLPALLTRLGFHDTCSVHSLHGLSGLLGALASVLYVLGVEEQGY